MSFWKIHGFVLFVFLFLQTCSGNPTELSQETDDILDNSLLLDNPSAPDYSDFFLGEDKAVNDDFREPRVVNGRNVRKNEFPHQVAILFRNGPFYTFTCAGSVYNRYFILTAAHCLQSENGSKLAPDNLRVIVGEIEVGLLVPANSNLLLRVANSKPHNDFNGRINPFLLNDIGFLELVAPLNYSASVRKLRVAGPSEGISSGVADLVGWGRTEIHLPSGQPVNEQPLPNPLVLRTARLRVVPRQVCTVRYFLIIPDTLLCVGSEGLLDTQSACFGDSGGPLVCQGPNGQYLCGIVSIGPGCGLRLTPAFYTDVSKYNTWIKGIAGDQD